MNIIDAITAMRNGAIVKSLVNNLYYKSYCVDLYQNSDSLSFERNNPSTDISNSFMPDTILGEWEIIEPKLKCHFCNHDCEIEHWGLVGDSNARAATCTNNKCGARSPFGHDEKEAIKKHREYKLYSFSFHTK